MSPVSAVCAIVCIVNGRRYVGSSKNIALRWREHRGDLARNKHFNQRLQADWNKHGKDAFRFEIIEEVEPKNLIDRERHWMGQDHTGYNRTLPDTTKRKWTASPEVRRQMSETRKGHPAWNKGRSVSDATRRKISQGLLGKPRSEQAKRNISAALKGRTSPNLGKSPSQETRIKISAALKGRTQSEEWRRKNSESHKGKPSANKGKQISDEQRQKISQACIGRPVSEEARQKISKTLTGRPGRPHTEEARRKMSEAAKRRTPWNKGRKSSQEKEK